MLLTLLLFVLAILGHTTLWISAINRLHARPWPEGRLRALRHVHEFCVVAFPPFLIATAGLWGPRLLVTNRWSEAGLGWFVLFTACWLGSVWLVYVSLRHWLGRTPSAQVGFQQHLVDVAFELGERPIASGPYVNLARLPFNGQYRVEISSKTIQLLRLPQELDGLTIWHISDWHFSGTLRREFYERIVLEMQRRPADLILFTGDLIDNPACLEWLDSTLEKLTATEGRYFILGNHDWHHASQQSRTQLVQMGWRDLSSRVEVVSIRDCPIAMGGDETPWMGSKPDFSTVPDELFRLLLSHTPDNIQRARAMHIDLMLAGHTHGGQVHLPFVGPVYSPSAYGCKYASGTFFEAPTLMHVSRGLAGIHPLRWRCPPEVTHLTLRAPSA